MTDIICKCGHSIDYHTVRGCVCLDEVDRRKWCACRHTRESVQLATLRAERDELREALKQTQADAVFMANVWKQIQDDQSDLFIRAHGDPDGIDFVANRILAAALLERKP